MLDLMDYPSAYSCRKSQLILPQPQSLALAEYCLAYPISQLCGRLKL